MGIILGVLVFLFFFLDFFAALRHVLTNLVIFFYFILFLIAFLAAQTMCLKPQPATNLRFTFIAVVTNQDAAYFLLPVFLDLNTSQA